LLYNLIINHALFFGYKTYTVMVFCNDSHRLVSEAEEVSGHALNA